MNEHIKAVGGNVVAWGAAIIPILEKLDALLQLIAIFLACGASIATWRYYHKKRKQLD